MNSKEIMENISTRLFMEEPLLFSVMCSHTISENPDIHIPLRVGQCRLEYNPDFISKMEPEELYQNVKIELIRILLKHPYTRKPEPFDGECALKASNGTIDSDEGEKYGFKEDASYEENYWTIYKNKNEDSTSGGGGAIGGSKNSTTGSQGGETNQAYNDATELWSENQLMSERINNCIRNANGADWGSIPCNDIDKILASLYVEIDLKKILRSFKSTMLSSSRRLTRMKPNRRSDFDYMGSTRNFCTKLLLAIDTSGSVSEENLSDFFCVVNKIFTYGIEEIKVLFFDYDLKGEPVTFRKARKEVEVIGRGGTSFQPVFDYVAENGSSYDGLIVFTDGDAPPPKITRKLQTKVAWVCPSKVTWERNHHWMDKRGVSGYIKK